MADVDEAIERIANSVPTATYRGEFAPGRGFSIEVPADLSPVEALMLCEKIAALPRELHSRSHRIVIPRPV